ncbi:unnamed protein product [Rhizoctonia solani]|uniref:Uncharacterized protein n=1 Tax=Rhizoctonia solani TaxID=456999 RepID=A0A8H3D6Z6_9AGAM|nr:unnamed protein product [Rhizoctonia solani]
MEIDLHKDEDKDIQDAEGYNKLPNMKLWRLTCIRTRTKTYKMRKIIYRRILGHEMLAPTMDHPSPRMPVMDDRFPQIRKALLFGKNDAPLPLSRIEKVYPEYEEDNLVLWFPASTSFAPASHS